MAKNTPSLDSESGNLGTFMREIERWSFIPSGLIDFPEFEEGWLIHKTYKSFFEARRILEIEAVKLKSPEIAEKYLPFLRLPESTNFSSIQFSQEDQAEYQKMEQRTKREIIDVRFGGTKLALDALADKDVSIRNEDKLLIRNHVIQKMGGRMVRLNKAKIEGMCQGKDYFSLSEKELWLLFHYVNAHIMAAGYKQIDRVFGFVLIKLLYELDSLAHFPEQIAAIRACMPEAMFSRNSQTSKNTGEAQGMMASIIAKIRAILTRTK